MLFNLYFFIAQHIAEEVKLAVEKLFRKEKKKISREIGNENHISFTIESRIEGEILLTKRGKNFFGCYKIQDFI
jgi:hypothetical protein